MERWQIHRRVIPWLKGLVYVAGFLLALYILPPIIFSIPAVQRRAAEAVEAELERLLETDVSLGRVTLHAWQDISVSDLVVHDELGREALSLSELRAGFEWTSLLWGEGLHISSIRLFAPRLALYADGEGGRLNISPIIDRLSSTDSTATTTLGVQTLLVRDGAVRYTSEGGEVLEADSIGISLSRIIVEGSYYGCNVQEISLRYARSLSLEHLSGQIQLEGDRLSLTNLQGALPSGGGLSIPHLSLHLSSSGLSLVEGARIASARLDLSALSPLLSGVELPPIELELSATASRLGGALRVDSLQISLPGYLALRADAMVDLESDGGLSGVYSPRMELRASIDSLSRLPLVADRLGRGLTDALASLEDVHYLGDVAWYVGEGFGADGRLSSALGAVRLDSVYLSLDSLGLRQAEGELTASWLNLSPLLGSGLPLSDLSGHMQMSLARDGASALDLRGQVRAQIDRVQVHAQRLGALSAEIEAGGGGRFVATVDSKDPETTLSARLSGRVTPSGALEDLAFALASPRLELGRFARGGDLPTLSGVDVEGWLSALDLRGGDGELLVRGLQIEQAGAMADLSSSALRAQRSGTRRRLSLQTPWLDLAVQGHYQLDDIWKRVLHSLYRTSPLLEDLAPRRISRDRASSATLTMRLDSIPSDLGRILGLPVQISAPMRLEGEYEEATDHFALGVEGAELNLLGKRIRDLKLELNETGLDVLAGEVKPLEGDPLLAPHLSIDHLGDSLRINLNLGKDPDVGDNGYVNLDARLLARAERVRSLKDLEARISLSPSQIRIQSSSWQVTPAQIHIAPEGLRVQGLSMRTTGRSIAVDGSLGLAPPSLLDSPLLKPLSLELENIGLRYILSAVGVDFAMLDTDLSGLITASIDGGHLYARGQVRSDHFLLEGRDAGALVADLRFDTKQGNINLLAEVTDSGGGSTHVEGHIRPSDGAGLDLHFEPEGFDLGFVQTFVSGVFDELGGRGTGHVRLFGLFDEGVTIEGGLSVQGGELALGTLGTRYYFDDEVRFTPEDMIFTGIRLRDGEDGTARIERGVVSHKYFDDFRFDVLLQDVRDMKVLDLPSRGSLPVYGRAYASGKSHLRGVGGRIFIANTLTTEDGTDVTLDFNSTRLEGNDGLMRFVSLRDSTQQGVALVSDAEEEGTPIDMHYDISLRPTAKVALRLGTSEQDVIKGWGEGRVQIDVPSRGSSIVNGELTVQGGQYDFRLKQVMYKQLNLHEGGRILLQGDPYQAQLDLKASYEVQASIADLDESLSRQLGQTTIPVQCIVGIGGTVGRPELRLELNLPRADSEVERRIRSLINTEEEANLQFLSLFVLGKFYASGTGTTGSNSSSNTLAALASTLISDQISSFIGNLSSKVRLGTSVRVGGENFEDTEIGLNYTVNLLNNRFLLRGSFGYHESTLEESSTYLTEFDAEYRLSRTLSLRAYNHYNTMYRYMRSGPTTQGLGIRYRRSYDRFVDLFRPLARPSADAPRSALEIAPDSLRSSPSPH